jgi:hypothetical protein
LQASEVLKHLAMGDDGQSEAIDDESKCIFTSEDGVVTATLE